MIYRFGGLQLRLISKLMSTTSTYRRNDDFSLERRQIVRLNREENRCDEEEEPINLENCYRAYSEDQVSSQGMEYIHVEVMVMVNFYSYSVHFHGGTAHPNTKYASQKMTTRSTVIYTTLST